MDTATADKCMSINARKRKRIEEKGPAQDDPKKMKKGHVLEARIQGENALLNFMGTLGHRMKTKRQTATDREVQRIAQIKNVLQVPKDVVDRITLTPHSYQHAAEVLEKAEAKGRERDEFIKALKDLNKKYTNFIEYPANPDAQGRHTNEKQLRKSLEENTKMLTEELSSPPQNLEDYPEYKQAQEWWAVTSVRKAEDDIQRTTEFVNMYKQHSECNVVYLYTRSAAYEPGFRFCVNHFCQSGAIPPPLLAKIRTDVDDQDMFNLWRKSLKYLCRTELTDSLNPKLAKQSFLDADVVIIVFGIDKAVGDPLDIEKSAYACAYAAIQFQECCLFVDMICAQYGAGGPLLELIDAVANYMGYGAVTLDAIRGKSLPYLFKGFLPIPAPSSGVLESTTFPIDPPWCNVDNLFQKVPGVLNFLKEHAMITEEQHEGTAPVDRLENVALAHERFLRMRKLVRRTPVNQIVYDWESENSSTTTACIPLKIMMHDYVGGATSGKNTEKRRIDRRKDRIKKLKATLKLIEAEKAKIECELKEGNKSSRHAFWEDDLVGKQRELWDRSTDLFEELVHLKDGRNIRERKGYHSLRFSPYYSNWGLQ